MTRRLSPEVVAVNLVLRAFRVLKAAGMKGKFIIRIAPDGKTVTAGRE